MLESLSKLPVAQRWRQQLHPMPSVMTIIRREHLSPQNKPVIHYLLMKRQTGPESYKWALVGGLWSFGETLEAAVIRHVKEKTGLDCMFAGLRGLVNERIAPFSANDHGAHFHLSICEVSAPIGTLNEQAKRRAAWFTPEEIWKLGTAGQMISTDYTVLQHFTQTASPFSYFEAVVVAGNDEDVPDKLVRFQLAS